MFLDSSNIPSLAALLLGSLALACMPVHADHAVMRVSNPGGEDMVVNIPWANAKNQRPEKPQTELEPFAVTKPEGGHCDVADLILNAVTKESYFALTNLWRVTSISPGEPGKLSLVVMPGITSAFRGRYQGFTLLLVNRTGGEVRLGTVSGTLPITCEARNAAGEWQPIEAIGPACGMAHIDIVMPASAYLHYSVPKYHGSFATKLRYRLSHTREPIYSAEFEGSIDPGQFVQPKLTAMLNQK